MNVNKFSNSESQNNPIERHEKITIEWQTETIPSERHPERNEDAVLVDGEHRIFGVFDGVSGGPAGNLASNTARDYIRDHSKEIPDGVDVSVAKQKLLEIIAGANEAIYKTPQINTKHERMATTGVVIKIFTNNEGKNFALVVNVGDSRAYKIDKNKKLQQITTDDGILSEDVPDKNKRLIISEKLDNVTIFEDLYKNSELKKFFMMRNVITKSLGSGANISVDVDAIPFKKGDRFLLTSDGIHDNLTVNEIQEIFEQSSTDDEIVNRLKNDSLNRSRENSLRAKPDDMSVVLVSIK